MTGPASLTVVGAGPGIGAAVARRFGAEGHPVGLVARNAQRLDELVHDLETEGVRAAAAVADARRPLPLRAALAQLDGRLGPAEVLCFSPLADVRLIKPVLETTAEDLAAALELQVAGAATAVGHVVEPMREARRGTLLFTAGGAAIAPSPDRASSGIVYAALNAYVAMLHETLAPQGVHVSQTVIVGPVGVGERHEPAAIAEHLWQRHVRRDEQVTVVR